jgi:hypothetical protein
MTIFGLIFGGMGLLFCGLIARDAISGLKTWTWKETQCAVTASAVVQQNQNRRSGNDFGFDVKYRYTFDGYDYASQKYGLQPQSSDDYGKMARLVERYASGSSSVCYVNPSAPAEAVLARSNVFVGLFIFFPLIFVAIGGAIIYSAWQASSPGQIATQSISDRAASARGQRFGAVFFSIFLVIGCATFYVLFLHPVLKMQSAQTWQEVPCVVISSSVKSHSGSKGGSTYSVNILYSYQFNGREHRSNAYNFMTGFSSSGYTGKQAIVARYPPGTKAVCYINPNEPSEAVLMRGFSAEMWFGLFPLLFVAVGGGGLIFVARQNRRNPAPAGAATRGQAFGSSSFAVNSTVSAKTVPASLALKPAEPAWAMFIMAICLCLFWNGIVSIFVNEAYTRWHPGHPEWGLMIFLIPFVAIGLVLVGSVIYCFLALFDPRPHLTVSPGAVPLGGTLRVQWKLTGRTGMLKSLHLRLEGREEATDRHGKNSQTSTSTFANLEIANATLVREMEAGEASVLIPPGLVPSFAASNNKIVWAICVHGEIPHWPDLKKQFTVTVLPAAPKQNPST